MKDFRLYSKDSTLNNFDKFTVIVSMDLEKRFTFNKSAGIILNHFGDTVLIIYLGNDVDLNRKSSVIIYLGNDVDLNRKSSMTRYKN
jgi:hypothetical protein